MIYSLPEKSFTLGSDELENIYLIKIVKINNEDIKKNSVKFKKFNDQGKTKLRDQMYSSYDISLNNKYKVKINEKTLERVKNYFN